MAEDSLNLNEVTSDPTAPYHTIKSAIMSELNVCSLGKITAFDPVTLTVDVQPMLNKTRLDKGQQKSVTMPPLSGVPISIPRTNEFALSLPIKVGDVCVLVFADTSIDNALETGDVANASFQRHHDISDAVAIPFISSSGSALDNYSLEAIELRNKTGTTKISLTDDKIELFIGGSKIEMSESAVKISASTVDINGTVF